jgi:phosphoglycerate-specific signal transduction histidine kinase
MDIPDTNRHIAKIKEEKSELWDLIRHAQIGRNMNCVTHEVNNWLGAMLAYTELVQMNEEISEESNRMLDEIKGAVEKSTRLLDTITKVSRKEKDLQEECGLNELLQKTIELYDFELKKNRVDVRGNYLDSSHTLVTNIAWLQRLIMYLLSETLEQALTSPVKAIRIQIEEQLPQVRVFFLPLGNELKPDNDSFNLAMAAEMASLIHAKVMIDAEKGYGVELNI